jgi:hypothetical protein
MDHGRLRELEWHVDDLWGRMCRYKGTQGGWYTLLCAYEAAHDELVRAL